MSRGLIHERCRPNSRGHSSSYSTCHPADQSSHRQRPSRPAPSRGGAPPPPPMGTGQWARTGPPGVRDGSRPPGAPSVVRHVACENAELPGKALSLNARFTFRPAEDNSLTEVVGHNVSTRDWGSLFKYLG